MAVVMLMRWPGATLENYDDVRRLTNFEGDPPAGGIYHACTFDGESLRIIDIWETAEDFQRFAATRLMPAVAQLQMPGEPQIEIYPAHNLFAPGYPTGA